MLFSKYLLNTYNTIKKALIQLSQTDLKLLFVVGDNAIREFQRAAVPELWDFGPNEHREGQVNSNIHRPHQKPEGWETDPLHLYTLLSLTKDSEIQRTLRF